MSIEKPKILVVDDIPENIHALKHLFRKEYSIIGATSGKKAIELVEKDPTIDLILLDILMPEMDGYEVCQIIKTKELTKDIPIIFVTSLNDRESEEKGLLLGAVDYIYKPVSPRLTKNRVAAHMGVYRYKKKYGLLEEESL